MLGRESREAWEGRLSFRYTTFPCRRAKAAFEAFQERELPVLKEDKPGLKQSQYKDMLWKAWQKAPDNPFNKPKQ